MKNIATHEIELPEEAPVMVLPGAVLLPNSPLPLYIFEPRYRAMLAHTLERERMFCIALMKPGVSEASSAADFFSIGGLGLVRACITQPDGTLNLILHGLKRVEFTEFVQERPFRIARLRELKSEQENVVEAEALAAKLLEICTKLAEKGIDLPRALEPHLPHLADPAALSDVIASTLVSDPYQRQKLLEQPAVSERLRLLIRGLAALVKP